jgi:hypothetical protein
MLQMFDKMKMMMYNGLELKDKLITTHHHHQ